MQDQALFQFFRELLPPVSGREQSRGFSTPTRSFFTPEEHYFLFSDQGSQMGLIHELRQSKAPAVSQAVRD